MRAEEAVSRRFLADTAAAETVRRVSCMQKVLRRGVPKLFVYVFPTVKERLPCMWVEQTDNPKPFESVSMQGVSKPQYVGQTDNPKMLRVCSCKVRGSPIVFVDLCLVAVDTDTVFVVGRRDSPAMAVLPPGVSMLRNTW